MSTSNVTENKMNKLFRRNGRSFKFHLEGLNPVENAELSKLIIENGGEICEKSGPPAITFTNRNTHMANDVVFHVNYIYECLKRRKLLDLINFKYGATGFYGCLMSIFISGRRSCPYTENHDLCYSSTQIGPNEELFLINHNNRTQKEHNYVNSDCFGERDTEINSAEKRPCRTEHVPEVPLIILDEPSGDSEFEPEGSLQDSDFLPDKSLSTTYSDGPDTNEWIAGISKENASMQEVPEPARFEELDFEQSCRSPDESGIHDINLCRTLPRTSSAAIKTIHIQNGGNDVEEDSEVCNDITENVVFEDEMLSHAELQEVRKSQSTSPEHAASSKYGTRKMKRKIRRKKRVVDDQAAINHSKDIDSPVILRNQFNQSKVLGGINESLFRVQKFDCMLSDSDDTVYIPTTIIDLECTKSPLRDSSIQLGESDDERTVLRDSREIPGPSRSRDVSEGEEEIEVIHDYVKTETSCSWIKRSDKRSLNPVNLKDPSKRAKDDRNNMVSSTRSSDDVVSIDNNDSDSLSEDDRPNLSSHRAAVPGTLPDRLGLLDRLKESSKKARDRPVSRNFSPWEQREMVKYLIDNECISEAKGNRVWQQMIEDGLLSHRTYQSLNNHFRRSILPVIHRFRVDHRSMKKFKKLSE